MIRVLVHLNNGAPKSYLLTFGPDMPTERLKTILDDADPDRGIQRLMLNSVSHIEIPPDRLRWSETQAQFTLSQKSYSVEQLA